MKAFAKDFEHLTKNDRYELLSLADGGIVALYLQKKIGTSNQRICWMPLQEAAVSFVWKWNIVLIVQILICLKSMLN